MADSGGSRSYREGGAESGAVLTMGQMGQQIWMGHMAPSSPTGAASGGRYANPKRNECDLYKFYVAYR